VKSSRTTKPHKRAPLRRGIQRRIAAALGVISLLVVGGLAWALIHWADILLAGRPEEEWTAAHQVILLGAAGMLALIQLLILFVSRYVTRRVTLPASALAHAAERVAAGDLTLLPDATVADDEMGRLTRAAEGMVLELRRLVQAIRESATETAAMSAQITAGTEQMSNAASEMAQTSGDLSHQASDMARAIAESAVDAAALMRNAMQLTTGARDGVARNLELRTLAAANRERLDASSAALASVSADATRSAESAEALAAASEEIGAFVTLVRKIARQSKLLALNASMEAARAGAQGEGFAVVAVEIRKLAASAADAGERTEVTVQAVLRRVEEARGASQRTRETLGTVQQATDSALDSFAQVEKAVREAEGWTKQIEQTAIESTELIVQATMRLDSLARGTENFAASMQQVAAASEQQSASTQEITAAASALADAARRLLALVSSFQLGTADDALPTVPTTEMPASSPTLELPVTAQLLPGT
jgi:methyl-accepting chemotaxis protein